MSSSARLRRVVSSSRSGTTPVTIRHTGVRTNAQVITSYFSSVIGGETDLSKITIICFDVKSKGSQIILNFAADTCGVFFKCRLTTINNFMKIEELYHTISPYGEIAELLYTLVSSIINQNTPIKTKKTLGIVITKINQQQSINTSLNNAVEYTVDKTERGAEVNNECPVCLTKFENTEKITLKCYHRICRDCLFNSIDNNLYTCPMCRKPFFPASNPTSTGNTNTGGGLAAGLAGGGGGPMDIYDIGEMA